jgi:hypothetical protein
MEMENGKSYGSTTTTTTTTNSCQLKLKAYQMHEKRLENCFGENTLENYLE